MGRSGLHGEAVVGWGGGGRVGRRELRGEEGAAWGGGGRVVGEHCDAQEAPGQATCPVRSAASHT